MALGTYVWPVNLTCPAGTPVDTPLVTQPALGDIWIDNIELRIPSGHNGLTGIYVANNNTAIITFGSPPTYLIGSDDLLTFDAGVECDTQLSIVTYNTDVFDHTFYLRISGRPMTLQGQSTGTPVATIVPITSGVGA